MMSCGFQHQPYEVLGCPTISTYSLDVPADYPWSDNWGIEYDPMISDVGRISNSLVHPSIIRHQHRHHVMSFPDPIKTDIIDGYESLENHVSDTRYCTLPSPAQDNIKMPENLTKEELFSNQYNDSSLPPSPGLFDTPSEVSSPPSVKNFKYTYRNTRRLSTRKTSDTSSYRPRCNPRKNPIKKPQTQSKTKKGRGRPMMEDDGPEDVIEKRNYARFYRNMRKEYINDIEEALIEMHSNCKKTRISAKSLKIVNEVIKKRSNQ